MTHERVLTRREFLKLGIEAMALLGLTDLTPALINRWVTNFERMQSGPIEVPELSTPRDGSVLLGGWYPHPERREYQPFHARTQIELMYAEFFDPNWKEYRAQAWCSQGKRPLLYIHSLDPRFEITSLAHHRNYFQGQLQKFTGIEMDIAPFFEPNIPYFRYGTTQTTPEDYVKGFQYAADLIRETLPQARVWFSPLGTPGWEHYYPGDDSVDGVAPHIYNFSSQLEWGPRIFKPNLTFTELALPVFATIQHLTDKPVMLGELGIDARNTNARDWIREALTVAPKLGCTGVCLFLQDREGENLGNEADWDVLADNGLQVILDTIATNTAYKRVVGSD